MSFHLVVHAFSKELEKAAFGAPEMKKVLKVVKGKQLPNRPFGLEHMGYGGAASTKKTMQSADRQLNLLIGAGVLGKADVPGALQSIADQSRGITGKAGRVFVPRRGDTATLLGSTPFVPEQVSSMAKQFKPHERQALDAVMKGHELDESVVTGRLGVGHLGHRSPDVILREHNKVVTLPPEYSRVGDTMRAIRAGAGEAAVLKNQGIEYGQGQRLSRHARKRLSELIERDALAQMKLEPGL